MGANFGDLDNDGFLDLYIGTGAPDLNTLVPNRMFRNAGGRCFQDVTTSGGFGHLQKGHGVSFGDLDNDGDQDVFEVIGGWFSGDTYQNVLYENPATATTGSRSALEGTRSNRMAIGARLKIRVATPRGPRDIHADRLDRRQLRLVDAAAGDRPGRRDRHRSHRGDVAGDRAKRRPSGTSRLDQFVAIREGDADGDRSCGRRFAGSAGPH